ncbi:hypothetical protein EVAR_45996_1 [Eumeta japonica]|uniref:Uncharacterized protein n=1 Tax=Eumeta variegata TaxID=151549 RepID=A0A4C1X762_EUMVA|nr:hypothetical protein EVAR_45996_1 [Eumeta japonica]
MEGEQCRFIIRSIRRVGRPFVREGETRELTPENGTTRAADLCGSEVQCACSLAHTTLLMCQVLITPLMRHNFPFLFRSRGPDREHSALAQSGLAVGIWQLVVNTERLVQVKKLMVNSIVVVIDRVRF